ncbi:MDR family MFS transporter [Brooklawnia cerclae]|uniref:EmrB/QacA subfamily drug resistance transporter n=1 Tax=Brooklawnia cerclae TaxID=349934 RepID=A0ABX0SNR0_9ACTN|nr:MDR family MFS transporter [Brooklawnia cerclae]NIH58406.1 EmrB/QacA subfamily drug resistance transporter [Brooklawnia cerclae]
MSDPAVDTRPTTGQLTHAQILTILAGLLMGMFLASLDQTIVSTSIRTIADDLHGLDAQAWVTTAYLITSTITTPLYGKLSDIYGRKGFFLAAIVIFIVGSALSSSSISMIELAGFRALQGVGAGGLFSLALAIIGDIVAPRERARYQGYIVAVFGTSSVIGPLVGGFFAEHAQILGIAGWRWVFLINVPLGLAALFVVFKTLHVPQVRLNHRVDWWGAGALMLGVTPLLIVAEQGRDWGWTSPGSLVCYIVGAVGIVLFVTIEHLMGDEALLPLRLFRIRAMTVDVIGSVVIGVGMFGGMMVLPLYLQIVHNASPMQAGLMMTPMVLGTAISSVTAGQITSRTGVIRIFPIIGVGVLAVFAFLLSTITADTPLPLVMIAMFGLGLGVGLCNQPMTLIAQNAVRPTEIGVATSTVTFFRQMGGTIGVATFLSMLFSSVGTNITTALVAASRDAGFVQAVKSAAADPTLMGDPDVNAIITGLIDPSQAAGLSQVTKDSSVLTRLPDAIAHPFQVGFATSISTVFLAAGIVAVVGLIVLLFMPRIELRRTAPAAQALADAQSDAVEASPAAAGIVDDRGEDPETPSDEEVARL